MTPETASVSVLQLKTELPRQRISLVERPELLEKFDTLASLRLLLVVAPPGFGKTVLLTQWIDRIRATDALVSWLSIDEGDADSRQFLAGLFVSLHRAGIEMPRYTTGIDSGLEEASVDMILRCIGEGIGKEARPVYIVLDDYNRSSGGEVDGLLQRLIQTLPANVHLILASRTRPKIGVHQLIASGLAAELNADHLRLSTDESIQLLNTDLQGAELDALLNSIEGWPIALSLASLAMRGQPGLVCTSKHLMGRGSHLSTYLAAELIGALPGEQAAFLLETSILERFDVPLANAVRGRSDSWDLLVKLEPMQSLITQIEGDGIWYRYHNLFAEYLRSALYQRHPALVPDLHARASRAFAERRFFADAVRHAAEAGDYDHCAALISEAGGWKMVLYGRRNDLASALRYMPAEQRRRYPGIIAADAYLQLKLGNLQGASMPFGALPDPFDRDSDWTRFSKDDQDVFNVRVLLRAYEDNELTQEFLQRCLDQRRAIPDSDGMTHGVLNCTLAATAIAVGKPVEAEAFAKNAMQVMREAGSVLGLNYCYLHAGAAALQSGQLRPAAAYLTRARNMADENFGEDSGLKSMADILWGNLHLWQWNLPPQMDDYSAAMEHSCKYDGWFELFAAALDTLFRTAWIRDDIEGMDRILSVGTQMARDRSIRRLELLVNAFCLLQLSAHGDQREARKLALTLMDALPIGCWKRQPHLWRPFQEAAFALFRFFKTENAALSSAFVDDMFLCAAEMGHVPYQLRALVARAVLRDGNGQRREALNDLSDAIDIASNDDLQLPFVEQPEVEPLLRLLKRQDRQSGSRSAIGELFLSSVLDSSRSIARERNASAAKGLSPRELEVALEIGMGHTNKEIARSLDLTEHTVKFHLKNIFIKLGVDRRAHVQALFSDQIKGQRPS